MKLRKFFYHYNKPLSKQRGKVMWSVHFKNKCHFADTISILVPASSKSRKTQPYAVMEGYAEQIIVDGEEIVLV